MFEKFSNLNIDSAGSGGEYTVQAGFGWTNGVALWIANNYGSVLDAPACPNITADAVSGGEDATGGNSGAALKVRASPVSVTAAVFLAIVVSGMML